ncbi:hypothetical protein BU14_0332s0019 [Porphyra umbilicalis]|uniref:Uncharacterized protein n=1 Tax=Porphyra umbilicalis TaxID=2786 RepID=A0A1X6NYN0_PORUM|nr:hypothetical protein BU14_0332s0019 [Porphyra umbilicalis]|eukprot:OSX73667.1 hypothetical protein BU14_0332s0019 [Porphyra umbilicalis]
MRRLFTHPRGGAASADARHVPGVGVGRPVGASTRTMAAGPRGAPSPTRAVPPLRPTPGLRRASASDARPAHPRADRRCDAAAPPPPDAVGGARRRGGRASGGAPAPPAAARAVAAGAPPRPTQTPHPASRPPPRPPRRAPPPPRRRGGAPAAAPRRAPPPPARPAGGGAAAVRATNTRGATWHPPPPAARRCGPRAAARRGRAPAAREARRSPGRDEGHPPPPPPPPTRRGAVGVASSAPRPRRLPRTRGRAALPHVCLGGVLFYLTAAAASALSTVCSWLVVALEWVRPRPGGGGGWVTAAGEVADGVLVALGGGSPVNSTGLVAAWWAGLRVVALCSVGMYLTYLTLPTVIRCLAAGFCAAGRCLVDRSPPLPPPPSGAPPPPHRVVRLVRRTAVAPAWHGAVDQVVHPHGAGGVAAAARPVARRAARAAAGAGGGWSPVLCPSPPRRCGQCGAGAPRTSGASDGGRAHARKGGGWGARGGGGGGLDFGQTRVSWRSRRGLRGATWPSLPHFGMGCLVQ